MYRLQFMVYNFIVYNFVVYNFIVYNCIVYNCIVCNFIVYRRMLDFGAQTVRFQMMNSAQRQVG